MAKEFRVRIGAVRASRPPRSAAEHKHRWRPIVEARPLGRFQADPRESQRVLGCQKSRPPRALLCEGNGAATAGDT